MLPNALAANTWIKFKKQDYYDHRENREVLFMGWINNRISSDNAVVLDDRGVITMEIHEEEWEIA